MLDEDGVFDGKSRSDGDIVLDGDEGCRLNDSFFDYYDLVLEEGDYLGLYERMNKHVVSHLARAGDRGLEGETPQKDAVVSMAHQNYIALDWIHRIEPGLVAIVRTEYDTLLQSGTPLSTLVSLIAENMETMLSKVGFKFEIKSEMIDESLLYPSNKDEEDDLQDDNDDECEDAGEWVGEGEEGIKESEGVGQDNKTDSDETKEESLEENDSSKSGRRRGRPRKLKEESNSIVQCYQCEFEAARPGLLKQHVKVEHGGFRYKCDLCDFETKTNGSLKSHILGRHEKVVRVTCDVCEKGFLFQNQLDKHKRIKHLGIKHTCNLCDFTTAYQRNLTIHFQTNHTDRPLLTCDQCQYQGHKDALNQHIRNSHAAPLLCDDCGYTTRSKDKLKNHRIMYHESKTFPCDICSKDFGTPTYLRDHKRRTHNKEVYFCDQCGYNTNMKSCLVRHVQNIHQGIRFQCDQCDYTASTKIYLKEHMLNKHEGVTYRCDLCDFESTRKHGLKLHKQIQHEMVRFPCDQCEHQAVSKSKLRIHREAKHEGITYPCDECKYTGSTILLLKGHKKAVHLGIKRVRKTPDKRWANSTRKRRKKTLKKEEEEQRAATLPTSSGGVYIGHQMSTPPHTYQEMSAAAPIPTDFSQLMSRADVGQMPRDFRLQQSSLNIPGHVEFRIQ